MYMKRKHRHFSRHTEIHHLYETNQNFVCINPMNIYSLVNDYIGDFDDYLQRKLNEPFIRAVSAAKMPDEHWYKTRKMIDYINTNIVDIQIARCMTNSHNRRFCKFNTMKRVLHSPIAYIKPICKMEETNMRMNHEFYRNTDTDFMIYRSLRYLEIQRNIDSFPIHTGFIEKDDNFCMAISAGFRKILKNKTR